MKFESFFKDTFLFSGMNEEKIASLLENRVVKRTFSRGELIYSPVHHENMLGFVFSGECEVTSQNSRVPLNTLTPPESFGIIAIFSESADFPTNIYAKRTSDILFIKKEDLFLMMDKCPEISKNIINFLIGRIGFLNKKIKTFSSENVESKLASYLLAKYHTFGKSFDINLSYTAEEINAGRASLYRALSQLEGEKTITRNGRTITVNNPMDLERK